MKRRRTPGPWWLEFFARDYYDAYRRMPGGIGDPQRAEREVAFLRQQLGIARGTRVLDVACGHGRHALRLAAAGARVVGLDVSAFHLSLARGTSPADGPRWVRADMRRLPFAEGSFDVCYSMFTSFGYFADAAEDDQQLREMVRVLVPGGRVLIDVVSRDHVVRSFSPAHVVHLEDGGLFIEERRLDLVEGVIHTEYTHAAASGQIRRHVVQVRAYTATDLVRLLRAAGCELDAAFGGVDGRAVGLDGSRAIVVGRKVK